jgi:hypothetical protein
MRIGRFARIADWSPVDLDFFRQPTRAEMKRDLAAFIARGLVLSYIFTGQVQHRYNYASQMTDAFPELRRYVRADVRYLIMADHTFSQESMREELAGVLVRWMRRCSDVLENQPHRSTEEAGSVRLPIRASADPHREALGSATGRGGLLA